MRFMMLMIPGGYEKATPDARPDAKAVEAMMKYNDELRKAGVLLALGGLHPPATGVRVSFRGGKPLVSTPERKCIGAPERRCIGDERRKVV